MEILILIIGPVLAALILAGLQWLVYKAVAPKKTPFFGLLMFRGLLILLVLITGGAFLSARLKGDNPDPMWGPAYREGIKAQTGQGGGAEGGLPSER